MGHLDNSERVIEVRLTSVGRKRLAEGEGIDITQFALGDDEIDYNLWQENVPPEDRAAIIENLPVFEAFRDETQSIRYKLLTFEDSTNKIPQLSVPKNLRIGSSPVILSPATTIDQEPSGLDEGIGYSLFLEDTGVLNIITTEEAPNQNATIPAAYNEEATGTLVSSFGTEFQIERDGSLQNDQQTTMTVVGNETGLFSEITVNVKT